MNNYYYLCKIYALLQNESTLKITNTYNIMRKKFYFLMLAVALTMTACHKDPADNPNPDVNDTTGGGTPALVDKNVFSVSPSRQVRLADGNLQFNPAAGQWRFAPHAYDGVKADNLNCSATYDGWIDCFRWASSGYEGHFTYTNLVYTGGDIDGTQYDWGVYNDIQNGDKIDPAGTWRTLSRDEWEYLFFDRSASTVSGVADARFALAMVANQPGIILIPDVFEMPAGMVPLRETSINEIVPFATNVYSADEWENLQQAGCAFLPALGCVSVSTNSMVSVDYLGCYWTSTFLGFDGGMGIAGQFLFNPNMVEMGQVGVGFPRPVRLGRNI